MTETPDPAERTREHRGVPAGGVPVGGVDARFTLAAERTVLAWIRTALGFVAGGVAIVYLAPDSTWAALDVVLGLLMVGTGAIIALLGARRWQQTARVLRDGGDMPGPSALLGVVAAIVVLAVLVGVVMVVQAG